MRGDAVGLDRVTLRAGIAALEGRRADAIAGYREALRGWAALGTAFDEALAVIDLATLLAPTDREMPEASAAIEAARETLVRLRAQPFLDRLDQGLGQPPERAAVPASARHERGDATIVPS